MSDLLSGSITIKEFLYFIGCLLPAYFLSMTLHEWGHAYASVRMGDDTPLRRGRLTLSPLAHIDWVGFAAVMLVGFGWAKPVPVNPMRWRNYKLGSFLVSIAGISMNFVIAVFFTFMIGVLQLVLNVQSKILYDFLEPFVWLNINLMIFNLLPIPPLDGYHLLSGLILNPYKHAKILHTLETYGMFILLAVLLSGAIDYVFIPASDTLYIWLKSIVSFAYTGIW